MLVEKLVKIIVVGDSYSGKTSLIDRYIFPEHENNDQGITIGVDFRSKIVNMNGSQVKIHFWDTAGQEQFRSVVDFYYRETCAAILVFDITNLSSFQNVKSWLDDIQSKHGCMNKHEHPILLIGNKLDNKENRVVSHMSAETLAAKHNLIYFETSAKENLNVETSMNLLLDAINKQFLSKECECKGIRLCHKFKTEHQEYQEKLSLDMSHRNCCNIL